MFVKDQVLQNTTYDTDMYVLCRSYSRQKTCRQALLSSCTTDVCSKNNYWFHSSYELCIVKFGITTPCTYVQPCRQFFTNYITTLKLHANLNILNFHGLTQCDCIWLEANMLFIEKRHLR